MYNLYKAYNVPENVEIRIFKLFQTKTAQKGSVSNSTRVKKQFFISALESGPVGELTIQVVLLSYRIW